MVGCFSWVGPNLRWDRLYYTLATSVFFTDVVIKSRGLSILGWNEQSMQDKCSPSRWPRAVEDWWPPYMWLRRLIAPTIGQERVSLTPWRYTYNALFLGLSQTSGYLSDRGVNNCSKEHASSLNYNETNTNKAKLLMSRLNGIHWLATVLRCQAKVSQTRVHWSKWKNCLLFLNSLFRFIHHQQW